MATLELNTISKSFGEAQVLHDIDLAIRDREFVVFVGPSGCGKSTLLRIIAGLEEATSGEIVIGGENVGALPPVERGISMVFQSYALYPHLTVFENIAFPLRVQKMSTAELTGHVNRAAEILQLTDKLQLKPGQLSGGQRQRVAIGRSIVRQPKVFLFDEPLSNLDAALRGDMRVELSQLHRELKATMVYVTHDQVEAMTMADRIVVLNAGRVEQFGTPMELYHHPATKFVAQFIGSPAMNLLPGEVVETGARTRIKMATGHVISSAVPTQSSDKGLKVNVGVRPEDMTVTTGDDAVYEGVVDFTEALGEVTILYFQSDGGANAVLAKMPGIHQGLRGTTVKVTASADKVQLFANGQSLYYR